MMFFKPRELKWDRASLPFNSVKQCEKCGGRKFKRTYVPTDGDYYLHIGTDEHLEVECLSCKAVVWELTKDRS